MKFDKSVTEKTKPFLVEEVLDEAIRDYNQKIIDYVSEKMIGERTCCFYSFKLFLISMWHLNTRVPSFFTRYYVER